MLTGVPAISASGAAIMRDLSVLSAADFFVILESTYGDRPHRSQAETLDEMAAVLREADAAGGMC
ncbi:MAG: hypothetical protein IPM80_09155 [Proteobacteria bacterium]|nr:hypothetical protein [Pseudomonadota bacterium]